MRFPWIAMLVVFGCGKKDASPEAKPVEAFKGPLTVDMVMAGKVVRVFEPWDEGFAALQTKLGPPTKIVGTKYEWAAQQGDDCAYFYVTKDDGKQYKMDGQVVGTVMTPMKVGKAGPSGNMDLCLAILGKDSAPPEDPNALPPPADGKVDIPMVLANAVKARSKWDGKEVTITATVSGTTVATSGTNQSVTLQLRDGDKGLSCTIDGVGSVKIDSTKPVTVRGTIKIEKWESLGSGGTRYEAALDHCKLAP